MTDDKSDMVCVIVTARDQDMRDICCRELKMFFEGCVFTKQYMTKTMSFKTILKHLKNTHPDGKIFIIENTNPKIGGMKDLEYIMTKAGKPFHCYVHADMRDLDKITSYKRKGIELSMTLNNVKGYVSQELDCINEKLK